MRKLIISFLAMVFIFTLAWSAGAQSSSSSQSGTSQQYGTGQSGTSEQYKGKESQRSSTGEKYATSKHEGKSMDDYKASKWIGSKIENRQGEDLGKVEDLVLNSKGQVDFVIVSHGGALGLGEKYTAIPFRSFSRKDENTLVLNMSKEKMAKAPSFDKDNWPDMTSRQWSEKTYRYYGQKPSWSESSYQKSKGESSYHKSKGESSYKSTQQPSQTEQSK